jgi:plastocyanin
VKIYPRLVSIFVVAAIAAIFTLGITASVFTPFPSGQLQQAAAQQANTTAASTSATTSSSTTTTNQTTASASNNKTFYLFNTELEGLPTGMDHYIYSLPVIVANGGDSVTVNLFNIAESEEEGEEGTEEEGEEGTEEEGEEGTEEEVERHAFVIDTPPYSVNIDTAPGELRNATFTADQEGVFQYYCTYHPQTMRGQLVVLPPSSSSSSSSSESSPAT